MMLYAAISMSIAPGWSCGGIGIRRTPGDRFVMDFENHMRFVRITLRVELPEILRILAVVVPIVRAVADGHDHI